MDQNLDNTSQAGLFTRAELDHLSSLHCINRLDDNLKAVASVELKCSPSGEQSLIYLMLELYFYDKKVDTLSFGLHNYSYDEVIYLIHHIHENEFLLSEIDNYLAGDIVE